jgi:hypothetical protein
MVRVTVLFYRYGWLSLHILSKLIVTSYNACQAWISLGYLINLSSAAALSCVQEPARSI